MNFTIPEVYNFQQLLPFATNPQKSDEQGITPHFFNIQTFNSSLNTYHIQLK